MPYGHAGADPYPPTCCEQRLFTPAGVSRYAGGPVVAYAMKDLF